MANFHSHNITSGLGTINMGVPSAGVYLIEGKLTLPNKGQGDVADSQVVATITINGGSAVYTGLAGAEGFKTTQLLAANDIVNITLTSAALVDLQKNAIKTTTTISVVSE